MVIASFQGLIKTLFWILFIYYGVRFLARLFLPLLAKKVVEKAQEQFQQQQHQSPQQPASQATTEPPKKKKVVGEYIDFEEIE